MSTYKVENRSCGHCTAAIENSVRAIDPGAQVACDLQNRTVDVSSALDDTAIAGAIRAAGYEPVAA